MSSSDVGGVEVVDDVVEMLGGVGAKMCHPGRHVRKWQQCQAVQHPDEVLGDVIGVVEGGQPQILHMPPRALA